MKEIFTRNDTEIPVGKEDDRNKHCAQGAANHREDTVAFHRPAVFLIVIKQI